MRILAVDVGTGTQDILLFDTDLQPENAFKLVMPSPTMRIARLVRHTTERGTRTPLLLTGVTMGGGPSHWAVRDHIDAGNPVFATPPAARTFDDDLDKVQEMGVIIIAEDEIPALKAAHPALLPVDLLDFDYATIAAAFDQFGAPLEIDGAAVAVFDHGAAPPDVSDRKFRFDYLNERIRHRPHLSTFAFPEADIPPSMTRLQAVAHSAHTTQLPDVPLMVMDTAPAAILGALLDPALRSRPNNLIANIGNFHTLAFRLAGDTIEGVFEHHTGMLDTAKLDSLISRLADSTLTNAEVFNDHGHGALILNPTPATIDRLGVTGPRRAMLASSSHPIYYAVPYGDMMIAGCFGLVRAWADHFPQHSTPILDTLTTIKQVAPWELL